MPLRIDKFAGEIPKIIPRLLPNNGAQVALNTRLEDGSLLPFRGGTLVHTLPGTYPPADLPHDTAYKTIYRHNGTWLGWKSFVNVAPGPVATDRLYVTSNGGLFQPALTEMIAGGVTYPLRLARPAGALTISATGTLDPALSSTIVYVYTYVTIFDEESPPSSVSPEILWSPGRTITLANINFDGALATSRGINRQRIYRSQTSALGETSFYLVAERAGSTANFVDDVTSNPIQEALPTLDYAPVPNALKGITSMPNGIMVGFDGKSLYFSEPFVPHAWPEKYILTTDFNIVGLGVFGQSVAVLTTGQPYIVSGITPDAMTMERVKMNLPCLNERGIVDTGYEVIYPSPEGIVSISDRGAELLTENLIGDEIWRKIATGDLVAGHTNGRYIMSYLFGTTNGMLVLSRDNGGSIIRATDVPAAMWNEPGTSRLFMLQNFCKIVEWDSPTAPYTEQVWRSKLNVLPGQTNFGAILVEGVDTMTTEQRAANKARWILSDFISTPVAAPPTWFQPHALTYRSMTTPPPPGFCAVVYADGKPVHIVTDLNKPVRLPAGFLALSWEVEIRGTMQVSAISLASSPSELAQL